MPQFRESAVILTGTVLDVETQFEYEDKKPTNRVKGQKVLIKSDDGEGFASVSFRQDVFETVKPSIGQRIAYVVRFGAWARSADNAQATCQFVREVTSNDLDRVLSHSSLTTA